MSDPNYPNAEHLGDGAYVDFDGHSIILRANDHRPGYCTDQVYLDAGAVARLELYIERLKKEPGNG